MTTHRVLNVHERNEAIRAAIDCIGRSRWRLEIFKKVYTGKQAVKTVTEIAKAIKLSEKSVLTQGKKLVSDGVVEQKKVDTPQGKRTAYVKIPVYTAHKAKVLSGVKNPKGFDAKHPTKQRPKTAAQIIQRISVPKRAVPQQVFVTEIDSFAESARIHAPAKVNFDKLAEQAIKEGIQAIVAQEGRFKDWGGEVCDLYTGNIRHKGKRIATAFAFKGKATKGPLTPAKMGKNGDQVWRLFQAPARMFIIVYPRAIQESVIAEMRAHAVSRAQLGEKIFYCAIGGGDFARLYQAYPNAFAPRAKKRKKAK
jgi:DNA-binding Lrp family transcriptional regulator